MKPTSKTASQILSLGGAAILPAMMTLAVAGLGCASRGDSVLDAYRLQREARLRAATEAVQEQRFQQVAKLKAMVKAPDLAPPRVMHIPARPLPEPKAPEVASQDAIATPPPALPQEGGHEDGQDAILSGQELVRVFSDFSGILFVDGKKEGKIGRTAAVAVDVDGLDLGEHHVVIRIAPNNYVSATVELQPRKDCYVSFSAKATVGASVQELGLDDRN